MHLFELTNVYLFLLIQMGFTHVIVLRWE